MENSLLTALESKGPVFRTRDLHSQGLTNYQISKLIDEGAIEKLYQGVYTLSDFKSLQITDINVIVENGIVSLTSAAFYYKLTDKDEGRITVTLKRDQKPPKIPYDLFAYYYTTSKFFDIGLQILDQNGRTVKIYDVERTVCDIIRHRSKYNSMLVREVVESYLARDDVNIKKLLGYAKQLRVESVVSQYLEILGGFNV